MLSMVMEFKLKRQQKSGVRWESRSALCEPHGQRCLAGWTDRGEGQCPFIFLVSVECLFKQELVIGVAALCSPQDAQST